MTLEPVRALSYFSGRITDAVNPIQVAHPYDSDEHKTNGNDDFECSHLRDVPFYGLCVAVIVLPYNLRVNPPRDDMTDGKAKATDNRRH